MNRVFIMVTVYCNHLIPNNTDYSMSGKKVRIGLGPLALVFKTFWNLGSKKKNFCADNDHGLLALYGDF